MNLIKRLWSDEAGQGLTEYALILGGIAILVIVTLLLIGEEIQAIFERVLTDLQDVPGGGDGT